MSNTIVINSSNATSQKHIFNYNFTNFTFIGFVEGKVGKQHSQLVLSHSSPKL